MIYFSFQRITEYSTNLMILINMLMIITMMMKRKFIRVLYDEIES